MNRNNLLIQGHAGLGDHIICNAIYRQMALMHELVCLPVKYRNCSSVEYMLRDVPNIVIRPVEDDGEAMMFEKDVWKFKTMHLGSFGANFNGGFWDESFYRQADVPFRARWDEWKCPRDLLAENEVAKKVLGNDLTLPRIFVHADPSRGIAINPMRVPDGLWVIPNKHISPVLFHWRTVIEVCDEIHCISSSFSAFIDSIDLPKKPKLFLHAYARGNEPLARFKPDWEILR